MVKKTKILQRTLFSNKPQQAQNKVLDLLAIRLQ
jgi:hypothetical protein